LKNRRLKKEFARLKPHVKRRQALFAHPKIDVYRGQKSCEKATAGTEAQFVFNKRATRT
jgi:hypothetical protein